jgi:hypothetical protein
MALALILAAPFLLIVSVGIFASMRRIVRTAQQREQEFQQRHADVRRRIRGLH